MDEFVKRFKNLKEDFDRGMMAQLVEGIEQVKLGVETRLNDSKLFLLQIIRMCLAINQLQT